MGTITIASHGISSGPTDAWSSGKAGAFTSLGEEAVPYVPGRAYQVGIVADGAVLEVWIDGEKISSVTDMSLREGSIALYT
jgi:hypothetical protein